MFSDGPQGMSAVRKKAAVLTCSLHTLTKEGFDFILLVTCERMKTTPNICPSNYFSQQRFRCFIIQNKTAVYNIILTILCNLLTVSISSENLMRINLFF